MTEPLPFTLLGTDLVLFRNSAGNAAVPVDSCCHRTARLSKGWVEAGNVVCPYHGWTYAADGRCVRMPQRPGGEPGKNIAVESFRCTKRYGLVWVALEEPQAPIPDWPEERDPGYRRIDQFYEPWACALFRLMENSFANAHIHFVHRNTLPAMARPSKRGTTRRPGRMIARRKLGRDDPRCSTRLTGPSFRRNIPNSTGETFA